MIRINTHALRQVAARSSSTAVQSMRQQAAACTHLPNTNMNSTNLSYFSTDTVLEPKEFTFKEMDDKLRESRKDSNTENISREEMEERNRVMEASRRGEMEAPPEHKPIPTTTSPGADQGKWSTADIHSQEDSEGVYQPGLKTPRDRDDMLRESKGPLKNNEAIRPPAKAVPGQSPSSSVDRGTNWPQSAFDQKMQEKRDKDQQDLIAKAATLVGTAKEKITPKLTDESKQILKEAAQSTKEKSKEVAQHPIESMGSGMKSAKHAGEDLFVHTKESTKETAEHLKEAKDALKESDTLKQGTTGTVLETVKEKLTPKLTDESKEILKEAAQSAKEKSKEVAQHPIESMGSGMKSAKHAGEDLFVHTKESTKETAEHLKEAKDALKETMPNSTEEVASTVKGKSENVVGNVQDKAKEKASQAEENAKQAASKTKDKAVDTASSMWKKAKQMVSGGGRN